jgi:hypothetical protein
MVPPDNAEAARGVKQKPSKRNAGRGASSSGKKSNSDVLEISSENSNDDSSLQSSTTQEDDGPTKGGEADGTNGSADRRPNDFPEGLEVKAIIRKRQDGAFLVYLDNEDQVRWVRQKDVFAHEESAKPKDVERLLARAQTTSAMPAPFLTAQQIETKSRFVGEAVALALTGDVQAVDGRG